MNIHLLNAAVMPHEGYYRVDLITPAKFATAVRAAHKNGRLKHYIGYQNTLDLLTELVGVDLGNININPTEFEDGDIFYIARLRKRVSPAVKRLNTRGEGSRLTLSDFDFYRGTFSVDGRFTD